MKVKDRTAVPGELARLGFERPKRTYRQTIYMSLNGRDKCGKTDFALRKTPDPITLINVNKGLDGVVQKFMRKKDIFVKDINSSKDQKECAEQFAAFREIWEEVVKKELSRTFVVDNMGEIYDIARTGEFGDSKPRGRAYGPLNQMLNEMLDMPLNQDIHVILIHNLKPEYANDEPTGRDEATGYRNVRHKVLVNAHITIEDTVPVLTVMNNRYDLDLFGKQLKGREECNFLGLGKLLHGEEWEA